MGEAKRRGNFKERLADAQEKDAREVDLFEIRKRLGLPNDAEFLGYVVHVPENDDYLALLEDRPDMVRRIYTPTPENSIIFDDFKAAIKAAKSLPREAIVGLLFDHGDQYKVFFDRAI